MRTKIGWLASAATIASAQANAQDGYDCSAIDKIIESRKEVLAGTWTSRGQESIDRGTRAERIRDGEIFESDYGCTATYSYNVTLEITPQRDRVTGGVKGNWRFVRGRAAITGPHNPSETRIKTCVRYPSDAPLTNSGTITFKFTNMLPDPASGGSICRIKITAISVDADGATESHFEMQDEDTLVRTWPGERVYKRLKQASPSSNGGSGNGGYGPSIAAVARPSFAIISSHAYIVRSGNDWHEYALEDGLIPPSPSGPAKFSFREVSYDGTLLLLHDLSRDVYIRVDPKKGVGQYRAGSSGEWVPLN